VRRFLRKLQRHPLNNEWSDIAYNLNTVNHNRKISPYDVFWKKKKLPKTEFDNDIPKEKFKLSDIVRVSTKGDQNIFSKKSDILPFSKELYIIKEIQYYNGISSYIVQEIGSLKPLTRKYYINELQPVDIEFLKKYI
jgi:hypothetical protein